MEAKIILPPYNRIGICNNCGASVYAPQPTASKGGLPAMSACACPAGPEFPSAQATGKAAEVVETGGNSEAAKAA
ncbi:MAG TPA: hypothetical protein VF723_03110 [Pyrinomonadaceae bacterium]